MPGPKHLLRALARRDRIVLLVTLFVAIVLCIVAIGDFRTAILSGVRGYVSGEGLWSKAQKAAVYHLTRYAVSHREEDFELYRAAIAVTLGDRQARLELEKPAPDSAVVRDGFLRGRNHPDDIPGMVSLFRYFRNVSYMDRAIDIWAEADEGIVEIRRLAEKLQAEIRSEHPDTAHVDRIVAEIADLDARLTPLEDGFSTNLGEGARWARYALTWVTDLAAFLLLVVGVMLSRRMLRAERRERDSASLQRSIVQEALDCIITADQSGRILEFNPAAERTFGWKRAEVVGHTLADTIVPATLRDAHRDGLQRYIDGGEARVLGRRIELTAVRRDGTEFPIELAVSAIERRGATIFAGHLRDLSERRQAEQAVREGEARRRAEEALLETQRWIARVADATPHILYLFDVVEERLLYVNRQVTRVLGFDTDVPIVEAIELLRAYVHPDDIPQLPSSIPSWFAHVADDEVVEAEVRVKDAAGEWHWLHSRSIVFTRDPDGSARQVLGTAQDVTERRHANDRLREHEAALAHVLRVSALGEMAAGLAHELNQPLAAIVSYARGCARRLRSGGASTEQIAAVVEQISSEALRAGEFIRHIRAFVAKEPPTREAIDLNTLAEGVARLISAEAARAQVSVELALAGAPVVAVVDRIQIEQVLLNFLRNAFDALASEVPDARRVVVRIASGVHGEAIVSVCDQGPGLDAEVAARVFEPFFTTKASGMGMGLAISRSIVEAHGGRLWTTAAEPHGAIFWIELPARAAVEAANEPILRVTTVSPGRDAAGAS